MAMQFTDWRERAKIEWHAGASTPISRMFACCAFVATFVVSGEARHQLLRVGSVAVLNLGEEINCIGATQRRSEFAVMEHLHLARLAEAIGKS